LVRDNKWIFKMHGATIKIKNYQQTPGFLNFLGSDKVSLTQHQTSRNVDAFSSK
jgi:hypothetical protein